MIYFISDLHLCAQRPDITELFLQFLEKDAVHADALYILGDFFEAWIGDDNQDPFHETIIKALLNFTHKGIPLYFMHGNRDFLIGKEFALKTGCTLLDDPSLITYGNNKIILTHGDKLCTLDWKYQIFRKFAQHPLMKKIYLSLPLKWRQGIATLLREKSARAPEKDPTYQPHWDVTSKAVTQLFSQFDANILIHGHTHRPGIHSIKFNNKEVKRYVLGDWCNTGNVLIVEKDNVFLKTLQ